MFKVSASLPALTAKTTSLLLGYIDPSSSRGKISIKFKICEEFSTFSTTLFPSICITTSIGFRILTSNSAETSELKAEVALIVTLERAQLFATTSFPS